MVDVIHSDKSCYSLSTRISLTVYNGFSRSVVESIYEAGLSREPYSYKFVSSNTVLRFNVICKPIFLRGYS